MKKTLSIRQSAVLEVMSKPKTPAEIRDQISLNKTQNLSLTLNNLVKSGLIYCLNPKARTGKLYGVTKKGIKVRRKQGFKDYHQLDGVDWNKYGFVVSGRQRRAILKILDINIPMPVRLIRERAQEYNRHISRINTYDVLKEFSKAKLVQKKRVNHNLFFKLTSSGQKIKQQLLIK